MGYPKRLLEMNPTWRPGDARTRAGRRQCLGKPVGLAPSEVELGRKVQLLDDELSIYLVAHLKHCLFGLFAKHDFTRYLEENDLER